MRVSVGDDQMTWQMHEEVIGDDTGETDQNDSGTWCQRWDDAYLKEWSVIFNEEMVGVEEMVIRDMERVLQRGVFNCYLSAVIVMKGVDIVMWLVL